MLTLYTILHLSIIYGELHIDVKYAARQLNESGKIILFWLQICQLAGELLP